MHTIHSDAKARDRAGISLVVVLGFLAVLSVLALGFAISMRVERLSSNVYYHGALTRQHLHTGLARAIDRIDAAMIDAGEVYPGLDVYGSHTPFETAADLLPGSGPDLLPAGTAAPTYIPDAGFPTSTEIGNVRWVAIRRPIDGVPESNWPLIGRYAWLAVNCSGFLDANTIGAADAREHGREAGEIRVDRDLLSNDFANDANVQTFLTQRDHPSTGWRRFESVAELNAMEPVGTVTLLFPFSLFPVGYLDTDTDQAARPVHIGGPVGQIEALETEIIDRFVVDMGLSAPNARMTWMNLLDYVDGELTPRNVDSFGTTPVPMINEIVVASRLEHDNGFPVRNWTLELAVDVELWYPFGGPPTTGRFTVNIAPTLSGDFSSPAAHNAPTTGSAWNASETDSGVFEVISHTFTTTARMVAAGDPPTMPWPTINSLTLRIEEHVGATTAGAVVDRVQSSAIDWDPHFARPEVPGDYATWVGSRWEVDDPRINWRWSDWAPAGTPREGTMATLRNNLNEINSSVTYGNAGNDGTWHMYVRRGRLETVGELGFLLYDAGQPWRTIPLLDRGAVEGLPVFDHFVVTTDRTRSGLVNPNANLKTPGTVGAIQPGEEQIASAFLGAPIERWPSTAATPEEHRDPNHAEVAEAQARLLAQRVLAEQPHLNLSDIRRADLAAAMPALDPLQLQGIIRNTAGLLSPRQNLFTFIVVAQSASVPPGATNITDDQVMGEARAVAVVWRDPYQTETHADSNVWINRSFIRFFRWLDD